MEYSPLVSVIVVTYNSSAFVIETLESILSQTYPGIELIISDDCSSDKTIEICTKWLEERKEHFVSSKIIGSLKNGGIVENCNKGVMASSGEWVKLFAGDDTMLKNCISDNVHFVRQHPAAAVVFSNLYIINAHSKITGTFPSRAYFFDYSYEDQWEALIYDNLLSAPAAFISRAAITREGGFDQAYPMMEDYPFWVKLLSKREKLYFMDSITVCYRNHDNMVSYSPGVMNPVFLKSRVDFARNVRLPYAKALSAKTVKKVKRDIFLADLKRHYPFLFRVVVPVLWWYWTHLRIGRTKTASA